MKNFKLILAIGLFGLSTALFSCKDDGGGGENPEPEFTITSSAFEDGGFIPVAHTCDGFDISPKLSWSNPPAGTKSFAIIFEDNDVPWDHWIVLDLAASTGNLPQSSTGQTVGDKDGYIVKNSFGNNTYNGPCPPGVQEHSYTFRIYALDVTQLPGVNPNSSRANVMTAINTYKIADASITGKFGR